MAYGVSLHDWGDTRTASADRPSRQKDGELLWTTGVTDALSVTWDPLAPGSGRIGGSRTAGPSGTGAGSRAATAAWRRLAAIQALDRRLHEQLDRSLVRAELAAARYAVASVSQPEVNASLTAEALSEARGAAPGLVRQFRRLAAAGTPPPTAVAAALHRLVESYADLRREVRDADGKHDPDADLDAVVDAGRRLLTLPPGVRRRLPWRAGPPGESLPGARDVLDPLVLPARTIAMSAHPLANDVAVTRAGATRAVVRVLAFEHEPGLEDLAALVARAIDVRKAETVGAGMLGRSAGSSSTGRPALEATVHLLSPVPFESLRFDVADLIRTPEPRVAALGDITRARRAVLFLAGWRSIVADVRIRDARGAAVVQPAARLRALVDTVAGDADESPLWRGGPLPAQLRSLAGLGVTRLVARMHGERSGTRAGGRPLDRFAEELFGSVVGAGEPLVAELVAAQARYTPH